jgi:hypothetical protein
MGLYVKGMRKALTTVYRNASPAIKVNFEEWANMWERLLNRYAQWQRDPDAEERFHI